MTNDIFSPLAAYLAKLERRRPIPAEEREALLALPAELRRLNAHDVILEEGSRADHSVFLLAGLISRQKRAHRTSHIISINFPGDAVDLQTLFFDDTDHALVAHDPVIIAEVPQEALIDFCGRYSFTANMLWHDTLVDSSIFREWATNIGHRRAAHRIGALFLEFEARLTPIGRVHDGAFEIMLTQQEMASALGLSLVHLNKSLRRLREEGLIATTGREIRILDKPRLSKLVSFNEAYLHLAAAPVFDKPTLSAPRSCARN